MGFQMLRASRGGESRDALHRWAPLVLLQVRNELRRGLSHRLFPQKTLRCRCDKSAFERFQSDGDFGGETIARRDLQSFRIGRRGDPRPGLLSQRSSQCLCSVRVFHRSEQINRNRWANLKTRDGSCKSLKALGPFGKGTRSVILLTVVLTTLRLPLDTNANRAAAPKARDCNKAVGKNCYSTVHTSRTSWRVRGSVDLEGQKGFVY